MIRYLNHAEIDKKKWDSCIESSNNGIIYAYSWYLDIVCPGWCGLVDDDYLTLLPLPSKIKFGFTYTYPPLWTQQLGVFSLQPVSTEKVNEFLSAIPSKYKYIEMNLNEKNNPSEMGYKTSKLPDYVLNLYSSYEQIYSAFNTQTKRNLKNALTNSLTYSDSVCPARIIEIFQANRGKRHAIPSSGYDTLNRLLEECLRRGMGKSCGIYDETMKLIAGAFITESNQRAIFLFSGANEKAYKTSAITLLINQYLEDKAGQDIVFDFEGSSDLDLARFYRGFGSSEIQYLQLIKNNLPQPFKKIKEWQMGWKI